MYCEYNRTKGEGQAVINSIKVEKVKEFDLKFKSDSNYYFEKQNNAYVPNNLNANDGTTALSYIEFDLTNKKDDYKVKIQSPLPESGLC